MGKRKAKTQASKSKRVKTLEENILEVLFPDGPTDTAMLYLGQNIDPIDDHKFPYKFSEFSFTLQSKDRVQLDATKKDPFLLAKDNDEFMLLFHNKGESDLQPHSISLTHCSKKLSFENWKGVLDFLRSCSREDLFTFSCGLTNSRGKQYLHVNIHLAQEVVFTEIDKLMERTRNFRSVFTAMTLLFDFDTCQQNGKFSLDNPAPEILAELYNHLYNTREIKSGLFDRQNPKVNAELSPYQIETVEWMLHRETISTYNHHEQNFVQWDIGGRKLYLNKLCGYFVTEEVLIAYLRNEKLGPNGGILADEKGLGKTVEMLALIASNQRKVTKPDFSTLINESNIFSNSSNPLIGTIKCSCGNKRASKYTKIKESITKEELITSCLTYGYHLINSLDTMFIKCLGCASYQHVSCSTYPTTVEEKQASNVSGGFPNLCSYCWKNQPMKIPTGATLVVVPTPFMDQWCAEVARHLKDIKMLRYDGVRSKYIHPPELATYDIVLVSYDTFRWELGSENTVGSRTMRQTKRYVSHVSPLWMIDWWRVCVDVDKMPSLFSACLRRMETRLTSKFRWVCTDKPIDKNWNDLYLLLNFIDEVPLNNQEVWLHSFIGPFLKGNSQPLADALGRCMRRTPKEAAKEWLAEANIETIRFNFSKSERKLQSEIAYNMRNLFLPYQFDNFSGGLVARFTPQDKKILKSYILYLRKTCCFPVKEPEIRFKKLINFVVYNSWPEATTALADERTRSLCVTLHAHVVRLLNQIKRKHANKHSFDSILELYRKAVFHMDQLEEEHGIGVDPRLTYYVYANMANLLKNAFDCKMEPTQNLAQVVDLFEFKTTREWQKKDKKSFLRPDDTELEGKAQRLFDGFVDKAKQKCNAANEHRLMIINQIEDNRDKLIMFEGKTWHHQVIEHLKKYKESFELISETGSRKEANFTHLGKRFDTYVTKLLTIREQVITMLEQLTAKVVQRNQLCGIKGCHYGKEATLSKKTNDRSSQASPRCDICKLKLKLEEYSQLLYSSKYFIMEDSAKQLSLNYEEVCAYGGNVISISDYEDSNHGDHSDQEDDDYLSDSEEDYDIDIDSLQNNYTDMEEDEQDEVLDEGDKDDDVNEEDAEIEDDNVNEESANIEDGDVNEDDAEVEDVKKTIEALEPNFMVVNMRRLGEHFQEKSLPDKKNKNGSKIVEEFNLFMELSRLLNQDFIASVECCKLLTTYAHELVDLSDYYTDLLHYCAERDVLPVLERRAARQNFWQHLKQANDQDANCVVCFDSFTERRFVVHDCGHYICYSCYVGAARLAYGHSRSAECGVCRSRLKPSQIVLVDPTVPEPSTGTMAQMEEFEQDLALDASPIGSMSSKMNLVYRLVRYILLKGNEKVVICCPWIDFLRYAKKKLLACGVSAALAIDNSDQSGKELQLFQTSDDCRVLLLCTKCAAKGLGEASHLIFVNPSLCLRDERRVIDQLTRFGQTRQPHVYKLVLSNTIETFIETYTQTNMFSSEDSFDLPALDRDDLYELML